LQLTSARQQRHRQRHQERRHQRIELTLEQADAQAFLFYCFIFGQSLLFLERGPRKRAQLIAKSAEKLLDDEA